MTLTVVGSIAFDAVETPMGSRDRLLGGAAVHFSLASSFLAETRVVGPVGDDFGEDEYAVLHDRGVVTDDIEHVAGGRTFFWAGRYERDDALPGALDHARDLGAGDQRQLVAGEIGVLAGVGVGEVDPGAADRDERLAVPRLRLRRVLD
jgi:sugar/nucleoside kinase (ribokinase family)